MRVNIGSIAIALLFQITLAFPSPELSPRAPSCPANQCNAFLNNNFQKAVYLCSSLVKAPPIVTSTSTKLVTKTVGTSTITKATTYTKGVTTTTSTYTISQTSTSIIKRQEGSAAAKSFSSSAVATCSGQVSSVSQACSCLSTTITTTETVQVVKRVTATSKVTVNSVTKTKTAYTNTVTTVRPTNLIPHGDFEDGTWWNWLSAADLIVTSPGQGGSNYAGVVNITDSRYNSGLVVTYKNAIQVNQGEQYYTSFNLMMLTDQCHMVWQVNGGTEASFTFGAGGFAAPVGQWTTQNISFVTTTTMESPDMVLFCSSGFLGPAMALDNIIMLPVSSTIYSTNSPATGTDLVQNGNFASGSLPPWTLIRPATTYSFESPGYNGDSYALMISMINGSVQSAFYLNQSLSTIVKDRVYAMSMAFKVDSQFDENDCLFSAALIDPASNTYANAFTADSTAINLPAPGNWGVLTGFVAAPMSNVTLCVSAQCYRSQTNVFHFDDLKLIPVS